MRCPHCKGEIPDKFRGKLCPSCGEHIPRLQAIVIEWTKRATSFTEERGFFFWFLIIVAFIFLLTPLEFLFGSGHLARLLDQHKFISLVMLVFLAAFSKILRNINTIQRPGYPGPYWTDRLIIRKFRSGTNLVVVLGFILSLVIVGPFRFFELLPAYVLIVSLALALFWSIESFRIDDREFQDAKVLSYFYFLGVKKLSYFRKVSGAFLIGFVVSAAIFFGLLQIDGLWLIIKNNPTLNEIIVTVGSLFEWVPQVFHTK
ncbi:MAG: hypothetical protein ABH878_07535 [bacterium]